MAVRRAPRDLRARLRVSRLHRMKRVLLTGATGFIGRHALAGLLRRGYEVHAVTSRSAGAADARVHWHHADLLDGVQQRILLDRVAPTHLVHLAWAVEHGAFWTSPQNLRWVGASLDLVRGFRDAGGTRVVMAGTCAEYSWGSDTLSEATTPVVPATLYGVAKDALHRVA